MNNKRGYSTAATWVFGLVSLFGLGVMYIVFSQVFNAHLVPIIKSQVAISPIDAATQLTINAAIDKYMMFFNALPFILFFIIIIYMILASIRKEREESFI